MSSKYQAVSSCASDATYHVMWIVLFNAIDEFGVKEQVNEETGNQGEITSEEIDAMKRKICDQACQGAVRIAGLVRFAPGPRAILTKCCRSVC